MPQQRRSAWLWGVGRCIAEQVAGPVSGLDSLQIVAEWSHYELHDRLADPTLFDFFWLRLAEAAETLIAGQGRMVKHVVGKK